MHERPEDSRLGDALEVLAGLAQLDAPAFDRADAKAPAEERVQAHPARGQLATGLAGREHDPVLAREPLQLLALDQRQVVLGWGARAEMAVADQTRAGNGIDALDGVQLAAALGAHVNADDLAHGGQTSRAPGRQPPRGGRGRAIVRPAVALGCGANENRLPQPLGDQMRQLTGLDTTFLRMESRSTFGHVSGLTIYDPSTTPTGELTREALRDLIESRLHLLPPFRWRLAEVPLKLDDPYWIEAPEFDIDFHVREIALAPPGDDEQLAEQAARIAARPLDRSRPLWELYVVQGLRDRRVGVLTKMHHSAIDGVSGAEIMSILLDVTPQPREVPPPDADWRPDPVPSDLEMLGRGALGALTRPVKMMRAVPRTLPSLADVPGMGNVPGVDALSRASSRIVRLGSGGDGRLLERQQLTAPRTSLNGHISPHRRFSFGSVPLADVKAVKDAFGLTVNDVVMAMCAGALRRWLIDHDELPADPLLAMVPVSVRTDADKGSFGNQVSVMVVPLPTHEPDLGERLRLTQGAMKTAKDRHRAVPATLMQDFAEFIPPAIAARATRVITGITAGRVAPLFNVVISNVPGPQFPLYSAGALMLGNYPVSAITDGVGLNMTVMSYNGKLDFGLIACREMVPDIWRLVDHLEQSLEEMKMLAGVGASNGKPAADKPKSGKAKSGKSKAAKKRAKSAPAG